MSFTNLSKPSRSGFTIYSKSKCKYCDMVKELLQENEIQYTVMMCDAYLEEDVVDDFLDVMENLIGKSCGKFPMVFKNGVFIGGYKETKDVIEKSKLISEECDF